MRFHLTFCSILAFLLIALVPLKADAAQSFDAWLAEFRTEARSKGISDQTLDAAFADVTPIPRVIELDRRQIEFTMKFDQYLGHVVNGTRIRKGRNLVAKHQKLLDEVSKKFGVQKRFIVALWGIETDFGRVTGGFSVIGALATLAHDGRRSSFFRRELLLALKILEDKHIAPAEMKGSWAGAMGQNQFMPSSFHSFAIDYDKDGDKDIWGSLPDVFGSIANYLSKSGWRDDLTWGREVQLPAGFDKSQIEKKTKRGLNDWSKLGVKRIDGGALPSRNVMARIIYVTEKSGNERYFLAYKNFDVTLKWNRSTYFALAVGNLADGIGGR